MFSTKTASFNALHRPPSFRARALTTVVRTRAIGPLYNVPSASPVPNSLGSDPSSV